MLRKPVVIAAAVLVSLSSACTPQEPSDRAGSRSEAPSASASKPVKSSTPPTPSRTPTPTPSPTPVRAADGRNLRACADGTCEVLVQVGDVLRPDKSYKMDAIKVAQVQGDQLRLEIESSVGGLRVQGMNVSASGKCVNGRCRDTGALTVTTKIAGKINKLRVRLLDVDEKRAVLALSAG